MLSLYILLFFGNTKVLVSNKSAALLLAPLLSADSRGIKDLFLAYGPSEFQKTDQAYARRKVAGRTVQLGKFKDPIGHCLTFRHPLVKYAPAIVELPASGLESTYDSASALNTRYGDRAPRSRPSFVFYIVKCVGIHKELQRRFDASGISIICTAIHPGPVATGGTDTFLWRVPYVGGIALAFIGYFLFGTWRKGATLSAFAAAGKDVVQDTARLKGTYFTPVAKTSEPSKAALDE